MGYAGRHSGSIYQQNLQAGKATITCDSNGDGTVSVTFPKSMKHTPAVTMTAQEADTTGTLSVTSPTATGFTAKVDGSSVTGDSLSIAWIAFDDHINNLPDFD